MKFIKYTLSSIVGFVLSLHSFDIGKYNLFLFFYKHSGFGHSIE